MADTYTTTHRLTCPGCARAFTLRVVIDVVQEGVEFLSRVDRCACGRSLADTYAAAEPELLDEAREFSR